MSKIKDLTGQRFGRLVVVGFAYTKKRNSKCSGSRSYWDCLCDCGNKKIVCSDHLKAGWTKSCGCLVHDIPHNFKDLTNLKFGNLLVISKTEKRDKWGSIIWECKCDCGNMIEVQSPLLLQGRKISCGCLNHRFGKVNAKWKGYEMISGQYIGQIKHGAKTRNMKFNITPKQMWEQFEKQKGLCALTGRILKFPDKDNREQTASLDRIDSSKGYVIGNIQWVHKDVNAMKWKLDHNYFIQLCNEVANYSKLNSKETKQ